MSQTIVEELAKPAEKERPPTRISVSEARAETPAEPHPETLRPPSVPAG